MGKIVQGVLNIFRKKKPQHDEDSLVGKSAVLEDGELFIGGESFGKVLKIDKLDLPSECFEFTDAPTQLTGDIEWHGIFDIEDELLKKLGNIAYPLLPKLINVPTLIVSCYANWEYDSVGVDISQLEETGIAHYWCTTTEAADDESASIVIEDAILLQWEDGYWEWSY